MRFRIFMVVTLIMGLMVTTSLEAFANDNSNNNTVQQENKTVGFIDIGEDTEMSEVLTFDEIVKEIAKANNISESEARSHVLSTFENDGNRLSSISPQAATYRTFSSSFTVMSTYKPTLNFYCQTSEGGGYIGIVKILNVSMNRLSNGMTKQFGGTVYANLETAARIYYIVNGDFYNNGTTSGNGGVDIGIGKGATIKFGISYATNHFKYVYTTGYYRLGN